MDSGQHTKLGKKTIKAAKTLKSNRQPRLKKSTGQQNQQNKTRGIEQIIESIQGWDQRQVFKTFRNPKREHQS